MSRESKESLHRKGPLSCVVNRRQKGGESRQSREGLLQSQVRDVVGSSGVVLESGFVPKAELAGFPDRLQVQCERERHRARSKVSAGQRRVLSGADVGRKGRSGA